MGLAKTILMISPSPSTYPTIKEIAGRIGDLPFSVDINNANGLTGTDLQERIKTILEVGAVGVNFEDRLVDGSGVQPVQEQVERIKTIRAVADEMGVPLFINARTDIFTFTDKADHARLLDEAVTRAEAYQAAGGTGFFVPGLLDPTLIAQLCERVSLPINIIRLPGAPSTKELADAGVARISYGPIPQIAMTEWLKQQARAAIHGEV